MWLNSVIILLYRNYTSEKWIRECLQIHGRMLPKSRKREDCRENVSCYSLIANRGQNTKQLLYTNIFHYFNIP